MNIFKIVNDAKIKLAEMQEMQAAMQSSFYKALGDPDGKDAADFLMLYNAWDAKYRFKARRLDKHPEDILIADMADRVESMLNRFYKMVGAATWERITA